MDLLTGIKLSLIYGNLGGILLVLWYFIFDKILIKIDFNEELKKGNTAVAIVVGAFLIAIALIVASAIS